MSLLCDEELISAVDKKPFRQITSSIDIAPSLHCVHCLHFIPKLSLNV